MPRRHEKARTGCITCKARKVKCDETYPKCIRCEAAGRKCAGYRRPSAGFFFKWQYLLSPSTGLQIASGLSMKCGFDEANLAFYRIVVAPVVNGGLNTSFWTVKTLSAAHNDYAAKRALLAFNLLLVKFLNEPADGSMTANVSVCPYTSAIEHYNVALSILTAGVNGKKSSELLLIICVLFVGIEYAQGHPKSALMHLLSGIKLLNSLPQAPPEIGSVFRHLVALPRFSGADISNFPIVRDTPGSQINWSSLSQFRRIQDAETYLEPLFYHCARLSSSHESRCTYSSAKSYCSYCDNLQRQLESWWSMFTVLRTSSLNIAACAGNINNASSSKQLFLLLEARWLIASIWVRTHASTDELKYDAHVEKFRRAVHAAEEAQQSYSEIQSRLAFNTGFEALLYFVTLKCRRLDVRTKALLLMQKMQAKPRQIWHFPLLCAAAAQAIEIEHGFIPSKELNSTGGRAKENEWARDELRIIRVGIGLAEPLPLSHACSRACYNVPFLIQRADKSLFEAHHVVTI